MADLVREGLQIPVARYDEARRHIAECKARVVEIHKATPIILVPAAPGPAPAGLDSTGDSRMNAPCRTSNRTSCAGTVYSPFDSGFED
jgi:hypothetical protein